MNKNPPDAAVRCAALARGLTRRDALALFGGSAVAIALGGCSREAAPPAASAPPASYDGPVHYMSLQAIARLIETRQVSPVQVTQQLLDRIADIDPRCTATPP